MVPVEDDYVIQIGRLAYCVTYLEALVLSDLPHLQGLPAELELTELVGCTTGQLGGVLRRPSILHQIADDSVRSWLSRAGELLEETAKIRNSVLHSRPATIDGKQMLRRWHPKKDEVFAIDQDYLRGAQAQVESAIREVLSTRPTVI